VRARILVRLKEGILDVQGATVRRALSGQGFTEVRDVRVGKVLEVALEGLGPEAATARLQEMCARLLANPVTEDFTVEILSPDASPEASKPARPLARNRAAG
jgi:phosphoribosylformylglycinamidine synthase